MPIYTFYNTKTKKTFDDMMSIAEMEDYLAKNKHIRQRIGAVNIVGGIGGITHKTDGGFKEVLSKIGEAHPKSALAKEMGTRSTKQIKTEQVLKKHRARQSAKNK